MDKQVAETILQQLGGNKFRVMTGASRFTTGGDGRWLGFKIGRNATQCNWVHVQLNAKDLYDITFSRMAAGKVKTLQVYNDIYNDQLVPIFEQYTGMYTKLF